MTKPIRMAVCLMWTLGLMGSPGSDESVTAWPSAAVLHALQPAPQDEFVPIDELPPQDQLPAAPLLVVAYAFAVLALAAYLISVARRLGGVQRDLERLEAELKRSGRT